MKVLLRDFLEPRNVERIRAVDPSVQVLYDADLVPPPRGRYRLLYEPDEELPAEWPEGHRRRDDRQRAWEALHAEAEVVLDISLSDPASLTRLCPGLRWLQGVAAGAGEAISGSGLHEAGVVVTSAAGVFSAPLAEFSVAAVLAHLKDFDRLRVDREQRAWRSVAARSLERSTVCVLGLGSIGREVARRLRPFGPRVLGVRRTAAAPDPALVDEVYPTARLEEALREADFVVVTLPHTPETYHLLDARTIDAIKPGAYLVNVGRGPVVDEAALTEALKTGQLSGAALDVCETEPLPEDSPLWDFPQVLVSSHATALVPGLSTERLTDLFCENLRRYRDGRPLLNVVDRDRCY